MKRSMITLAVLLAVSAAYGAPQGKYSATVTGVVVGPTGKPVPNAIVTYQSGGGDTPHVVHTDAHGHFTIAKLRRDNYDLRASWHGLFSTWQKNVMVRTGQQKSVTLRLTSGADVSKTALQAPQQ
jgi:hypothetical protein